MKSVWCFLCGLILCLIFFVACGSESDNQLANATEYYNVQANQKEIGALSQDKENCFFLNAFFYQGEPVQIWYTKKDIMDDSIDVYLYHEDESAELLVSGISEEYRGVWFLDVEKNIYIIKDKSLTRMTTNGTVVYNRIGKNSICDICQIKDGTIWLLVQTDDSAMKLAVLDAQTGEIVEKSNVNLEDGTAQYISEGVENDLLVLNNVGLWCFDSMLGSLTLLFDFSKTSYQVEMGLSDFFMVNEKCVELLYNDKVESLQIEVIGQQKEVITIRDYAFGVYMEQYVEQYNQQSDRYFVVLERGTLNGLDTSGIRDFRTQTNIEIVNGGGADILSSNSLGDVFSYIEKGAIEDLKPYLERSCMKEEDFFPVTFAGYRSDEQIYSMKVSISGYGLCLDSNLTGGMENPNIEEVLDALLDTPEETILKKKYTASHVLKYFLQGSDSLWGTIDWESRICDFNSELFEKLLEVSKAKGYDEKKSYVELAKLVSDSTFFTFELEDYLEGEGMQKIGYFFDDGCYMVMDSTAWLMNSNSENKEGAWDFMRFLLSKEFQTSWEDDSFPTNREAFEQMAQREKEAGPIGYISGGIVYKAGIAYYRTYGKDAYIERFGLSDAKIDEIRKELENIRALPNRIEPLLDIILDEASYYFNDTKTIEEVIPIIENRVQLYLDEHR